MACAVVASMATLIVQSGGLVQVGLLQLSHYHLFLPFSLALSLPSFLPSFIPSFIPFCLSFFLPFFLPSFHPSFHPSFFPSFKLSAPSTISFSLSLLVSLFRAHPTDGSAWSMHISAPHSAIAMQHARF